MIDNFKSYFFDKRLKSDIKKNKVVRKILNIDHAKTVGIVFDASRFSTINSIVALQNMLKNSGKSVSIYGYINTDDKKNEQFLFSNSDLNWYGYPRKEELFKFCNIQFDILLGIMSDKETPLSVIFANSKARFRIGADVGEDKYELFDLIVSTSKKNRTIQTQINSILKFLKEVNTE